MENDLQTELYGHILDALADGPRTARELLTHKPVADLGFESLREALHVLVGARRLQPCLDEVGEDKRAEHVTAFNRAVLRTGGGIR
jgi:hypothetical protein